MANRLDISTKRIAISKANAQMIVAVAVASFVAVFCLIASNSIWSQTRYQAQVTSKDQVAKNQLVSDTSAYKKLVNSYDSFDSASTNIIGGSSSGTGNNIGSNAQIILDALPPTYDFPALTSSVEKILKNGKNDITGLTGIDNELTESSNTSSPNPSPVAMPFGFTVENTNYQSAIQLITELEESIRPIQIDTMDVTADTGGLTLTVTAHTYYQPAKTLSISKKVLP
jgi:hypothetical protein